MKAALPNDFQTRLALFAAAGLASGGAILIKIVPAAPGSAVAGAVLLMLLRRKEAKLSAAAALGGVFAFFSVLPMLLAGLAYAHAGALPDFLYSNFGFASAYSAIHPKLAATAQRLARVADSLWPLIALAFFGLAAMISDWRRRQAPDVLLVLAAVWLVGELVAASASRHFWPHYFLSAIPALVLLSSYGIRAIVRGMDLDGGTDKVAVLLSVIALLIPFERTNFDAISELNSGPDVPREAAAAIRQASGSRTPTLFVADYQLTALYSLTGASLPTRYAVAPHLLSRQSAMIQADPAGEIARVLATRPDFIVIDVSNKLPRWAALQFDRALTRYRVAYEVGNVRIYQALRTRWDKHGSRLSDAA